MKLKSFGCSFIFGTDLHDDGRDGPWATPSNFSWPALLAKELGYSYECYARPGSGNLQIWDHLINQLSVDEPSLYVIGWTWIDRFDYVNIEHGPPGSGSLWKTIMPVDTSKLSEVYYKQLHTERRDKLSSLLCIQSAIDLLLNRGHSFIMTSMDPLLLDRRWNISPGMKMIQDKISPYLKSFNGKNFLEYSSDAGHEISKTQHPLESAHQDVSNLVIKHLDYYISSNERTT